MIKYKSNCKVCKAIKGKGGKKLSDRIYFSTHYNPKGEESLLEIANAVPDFSYDSLRNHVKKHQFISKKKYDQQKVNEIQERGENQLMENLRDHQEVRKLVMEKGIAGIDKGEIKLTAGNVITAARDQSNWEDKQADRQLQIMEMIYHYASGEGIIDVTPEPAGNLDTGEDRPDTIHNGTPWDAITPGTDSLSTEHPQN